LDSDSLTETKNWNGRNEVIETSGRLHPLWPQNKRLRTSWTTNWMHTGQDRWIQTEMAFTLAKNATKPNTFEIISLQTTRKKNNWKTEETLARAVVTLETERIKGSNPWCLWWRWWWWWRMCRALFRRYQLFPEMEEMLIEKVRQRTFLYDTKSPDYRDQHMRDKAWEGIGKELKIKRFMWVHVTWG